MSIIINRKAENFISEFVGKRINSPEQRLLQGLTALGMQPFIDYNNKSADPDTRAVSVARTIGKIVAGTVAGVTIRYASIYLAKAFSRYTLTEGEKFITSIKRKSKKDILLPNFKPEFYKNMTKEEFETKYDNTIKTIGTLIATVSMIFTNFLVDAPLTKIITKRLTNRIKKHIEKKQAKEVNNNAQI